jgi:mannose-6-phosphate isomerase
MLFLFLLSTFPPLINLSVLIQYSGIHAYLSGNIVECMARSDNVINTGFCPRADRDDVSLFTNALTFSPSSGEDAILKPTSSNKGVYGKTKVLAPPMSEFNMLITQLGPRDKETIKGIDGPSVILVTAGKGTLKAGGEVRGVKEGYIFFLGAGTELNVTSDDGLELHMAYCEA